MNEALLQLAKPGTCLYYVLKLNEEVVSTYIAEAIDDYKELFVDSIKDNKTASLFESQAGSKPM